MDECVSMLMRVCDVADEYAERTRDLRLMMIGRGAESDALEEVDQLCRYFDSTAGLIAQETRDAEDDAYPPTGGEARQE